MATLLDVMSLPSLLLTGGSLHRHTVGRTPRTQSLQSLPFFSEGPLLKRASGNKTGKWEEWWKLVGQHIRNHYISALCVESVHNKMFLKRKSLKKSGFD